VREPKVFLRDEPLSNLDAKVREQARFWLRDFQQRLGITTVYVTHDQGEALAISDLVAVMSAGHLLQYAPPKDVYERPASRFVAGFIGQTSFLPVVVVEAGGGAIRARLASTGAVVTSSIANPAVKPGDRVALAIRSERIETRPTGGADNVIDARIASFVYVGSAYEYIFETAEGEIRASSPTPLEGPEVHLYLPPDAIVVLPEEDVAEPPSLAAELAAVPPAADPETTHE